MAELNPEQFPGWGDRPGMSRGQDGAPSRPMTPRLGLDNQSSQTRPKSARNGNPTLAYRRSPRPGKRY